MAGSKVHGLNGPRVGAIVPAPVLIGNVGKSVAENVEGWIFFRPVPIGDNLDLGDYKKVESSKLPEGEPIPAWVKFTTGVIFPNDPVGMPSGVAFARTPAGKTKAEAVIWDKALQDEWDRGDIYLALHGKFTYNDPNGGHHWSTFCNVFMAPNTGKNISIDNSDRCTAYNTIDDNR